MGTEINNFGPTRKRSGRAQEFADALAAIAQTTARDPQVRAGADAARSSTQGALGGLLEERLGQVGPDANPFVEVPRGLLQDTSAPIFERFEAGRERKRQEAFRREQLELQRTGLETTLERAKKATLAEEAAGVAALEKRKFEEEKFAFAKERAVIADADKKAEQVIEKEDRDRAFTRQITQDFNTMIEQFKINEGREADIAYKTALTNSINTQKSDKLSEKEITTMTGDLKAKLVLDGTFSDERVTELTAEYEQGLRAGTTIFQFGKGANGHPSIYNFNGTSISGAPKTNPRPQDSSRTLETTKQTGAISATERAIAGAAQRNLEASPGSLPIVADTKAVAKGIGTGIVSGAQSLIGGFNNFIMSDNFDVIVNDPDKGLDMVTVNKDFLEVLQAKGLVESFVQRPKGDNNISGSLQSRLQDLSSGTLAPGKSDSVFGGITIQGAR